jgi:hypothetical protein
VKRLIALFVGLAFVAGTTGFVAAQTPATTDKKMDKSADTKPAEKKMAVKVANGTVKSAAPDNVVVAGKDKGKDAEWTFSVTDKTKIKKAGKDITAKDLATGDSVNVRYMDHEGKATASAITVRPGKMAKDAKATDTKPADKK